MIGEVDVGKALTLVDFHKSDGAKDLHGLLEECLGYTLRWVCVLDETTGHASGNGGSALLRVAALS